VEPVTPSRCRRDAVQVEPPEAGVVGRHRSLALEHVDGDAGLQVCGGGEALGLAHRHRGVAGDERGGDPTQRLHAERERSHVDQDDLAHLAREHAGLDGGTAGDALHRVDAHLGGAAEHVLEEGAHGRHPGGSAHEHDPVDLRGRHPGILQRLFHWGLAAFDHRPDQVLQLGAAEVQLEVSGLAGHRAQIRQADVGGDAGRQFDLGQLRRLPQAGGGLEVGAHVDPGVRPEPVGQVVEHPLVHVGATQVGVAAGGLHLEHAATELEDGHVQRAAAQVDDGDAQLLAGPVQPVGERRSRRLVDEAGDLDAGDAARVLGGGPLVVVEVGGHRDHRLGDRLAQERLGVTLELAEQERGQLLGRDLPVAEAHGHPPAHLPLERGGGPFRVRGGPAARRFPDEHLPVRGHRH